MHVWYAVNFPGIEVDNIGFSGVKPTVVAPAGSRFQRMMHVFLPEGLQEVPGGTRLP